MQTGMGEGGEKRRRKGGSLLALFSVITFQKGGKREPPIWGGGKEEGRFALSTLSWGKKRETRGNGQTKREKGEGKNGICYFIGNKQFTTNEGKTTGKKTQRRGREVLSFYRLDLEEKGSWRGENRRGRKGGICRI